MKDAKVPPGEAPHSRSSRLVELAGLFLRLGTTAFGGPAAHIAMMQDEVVHRRRWLTEQEFLDLVGATQLIPGPNSTELAIHIGHRRAGWGGLLIAGCCFIVPATLLVGAIAWSYVRFGKLPMALAIMEGIKPVIIAIVVQALWRLGKTAVKSTTLGCVGIAGLLASAMGMNELMILFGGGLITMLWARLSPTKLTKAWAIGPAALAGVTNTVVPAVATPVAFGLLPLFLIFLKIGSVLFGSGYVLLAFLRADLVERYHWLTEAQLLDAIAVGQITPGPVFTTATFIGYLLGGSPGAAIATAGIFLPAFFFVAISGPLVPRLRRSPAAAAFLDGLNVASLALMAVVTWQLARAGVPDVLSASLAIMAAVLLFRYRLNSVWLVLAGAAFGVARALLGVS